MTDRPDRFNTHAPPPLEAEGLPAEEGVERARLAEQLHTDPERVPDRPDSEAADDDPGATHERGPDEQVGELVKGVRTAMLTTTDEPGRLVSQPMATQDVETDGDPWFITERSSAKVDHVRSHPRVSPAPGGEGRPARQPGEGQGHRGALRG